MNKENNLGKIDSDSVNIREQIDTYLMYWKWFVLSIIVSLFIAHLYLRYTTPVYSAETSILIKDNQKSGISKELGAFKDLGIIGGASSNNPDNEIEIIKSRKIVGKVVDVLDLNITYSVEGRVKKTEIYKENPIQIQFLEKNSSLHEKDTLFSISILSDTKFQLLNIKNEAVGTYSFDEKIASTLGVFSIKRKENFYTRKISFIYITLNRKESIISRYSNGVNVKKLNEDSSVLILTFNYPIKDKAEDFLDELVNQYNLDAISDKNEVSKKTIDFISERLTKVGEDLETIQDSVKRFKTINNISGLSSEGELALQNESRNNDKVIAITTELNLANSVLKSIKNELLKNELLPENLGFSDNSVAKSIANYNQLVMAKNKLALTAGDKSPTLIQYVSDIESLKKNIQLSISNLIYSLGVELNDINKQGAIVSSKVSSLPGLERGFIDISRQQEIYSGLYSYLLKKKEETAISLAVTVPNARIIDAAYGSNAPVKPQNRLVYLASLIIGLILPFGLIYLRNLLDTKVHNKKDLEERLTVPFLGDIPKSDKKEKVIVGNEERSSSSEAFRLIRTNLEFLLAGIDKVNNKVIFVTSTTSGEGKSFISINIATILALSGKKTLLLGMDLRAPKVNQYLGVGEGKNGVTNYIKSKDMSISDIIYNIPQTSNLDVISSGAIPPNPAELLISKRLELLFEEVKTLNYDYIIVDTAPVNLVSDTLLISKYADVFLYVVRANYLDKRLLELPEELYKNKRLPNMSIILNDTDPKRMYGYGYGYGGYGRYGGYGYGYGYGVLSDKDKNPWYKKMFTKK